MIKCTNCGWQGGADKLTNNPNLNNQAPWKDDFIYCPRCQKTHFEKLEEAKDL